MRILLVSELHFENVSGYLRVLKMLHAHLSRIGHEVTVMIPAGSSSASHPSGRIVEIMSLPLPFYRELRMTLFTPQIINTIRDVHPDLIHLFQPTCLGAYVSAIANYMDIPIVASFHGNIDQYCDSYNMAWLKKGLWGIVQQVHRTADITLAPSPSTVARLRELGFDRVRLWSRGIDMQQFSPAFRNREILASFGISSDRPVALSVGRIAREKNLDILLDYVKQNSNVQLVVVGDGPYRNTLEKRLRPYGVCFPGYVQGASLSNLYASSDLFLFPSQTETFGQVALEAMASGLPVIAFESDGLRDIVVHERTGYLARNAEEWINYATQVTNSTNLKMSLASECVASARQWTWDSSMRQVTEAYSETIHRYQERTSILKSPQLKTTELPDHPIHVIGHGPDICFLHGFLDNWQYFEIFRSSLQTDYRLCFIDVNKIIRQMLVQGQSLAQLPDIIVELLDTSGISPLALVGFSFGSNLLWEISERRKSYKSSLILLAPFYHPHLKAKLGIWLGFPNILQAVLRNRNLAWMLFSACRRSLNQSVIKPFNLEIMRLASITLGEAASNVFAYAMSLPKLDANAILNAGSAIVIGENDRSLRQIKMVARSHPKLTIIPQMAHNLYDQEDLIIRHVKQIVTSISKESICLQD